ncbi:MAG: tRNA (adenosine(37)-N6)-threonylcarbamoyltransferase complex ATPase subunit type 1 TsaE [Ignavibacteriota bacterium]|nr:MAG: tRNA (adenosine(37)-N6)-threonylcarbamoyltransferase complex ATPase subunit type 1 TsaE [Chlorobiota bacterium]MBE7477580.1 tRNA (adenosine(37)-N6)-threonylcarbamoyltransferase complex ATPase subunit type 1 TsaE [Ignavibacteriales bacterium]MBL1124268.1 tRNA (adenosine(37)-N6)-threonylcarbamoyltransferase complex ATPase subunit type 1 TsaE [Ignavibacteriota bacterium]MBV6420591.1 tRNA threonylcarbamoyladenosine biosynthesis protein TsaE [Ignavibacteriaceae bacterium]MCE7855373.1 tRNA (a
MDHFPFRINTRSEEESAILAADFIKLCTQGERIVLNGDLGAGKTFFIKAALASIGITNVNSPSFAIVNEYHNSSQIYHFDFYRLKNYVELLDIGWQDYLNDEESIIFIEWGNRFNSILPSKRIEINILTLTGSEREFSFEKIS